MGIDEIGTVEKKSSDRCFWVVQQQQQRPTEILTNPSIKTYVITRYYRTSAVLKLKARSRYILLYNSQGIHSNNSLGYTVRIGMFS